MGIAQIFGWGCSYYLLGVLAAPISADTGWPFAWTVAGLSVGVAVAGLVSPHMGRAVSRRGGRSVLAASTLLMAAGLLVVAASPNMIAYFVGWGVMGLGMGIGLYDAAFATLGQHLGPASRRPITALTLIAGFASTVTWPLSAFLLPSLGWRGVCLAYAAIEVALCLPLYLAFAPWGARMHAAEPGAPGSPAGTPPPARTFYVLAAIVTAISAITAFMSVNLIAIVAALGVERSAAVAFGALLGPSQVAARLAEMFLGRRYHPAFTLVLATGGVAVGIVMLLVAPAAALPAIVLYGGGIGLGWVARGTVPMALFGPATYAVQVGRLARPGLIAQAIAPTVGALLMQGFGVAATLAVLAFAALAALALALALTRAAPAAQ
jgi:hypothetical protein